MSAIRYPFTVARLTAESLPATGRKQVWDAEVRGLCVRITPDGSRVFYLSLWHKSVGKAGGQFWLRIGPHPEVSPKEARNIAQGHIAAIARGEKPWEARRELAKEATLTDLWKLHEVRAKGKKRASTLALYKHAWAHLAKLHDRRVGSITRGDIQRVVDEVGKETPTMANRVHSLVGVLYQTAIAAERWKGANPAEGVERWPETSRDRYLLPKELQSWWQALEYEPESWRIYFATAVLCGARRANLCGMRWADLDLTRGLWSIPGEKSKSGEPLLLVLTTSLVALLTDWRDRCPSQAWVFPSPDPEAKTAHVNDPKRPWSRIVARATLFRLVAELGDTGGWSPERITQERNAAIGEADRLRVLALSRREKIDGDPLGLAVATYAKRVRATGRDPGDCDMADVRVHDLRRTLGSWATITGASLPIVGRALGHRSLSATQVYARLSMDPVRAAVETAAGAIVAHGGEAAQRVLAPTDEGGA